MTTWSTSIKLVGAGGEPVEFARTLLSHGVADLPPNELAPGGTLLSTVLTTGEGAWLVELMSDGTGRARLGAGAGATAPPTADRPALAAQIRHMLRLDEDLSPFTSSRVPIRRWPGSSLAPGG